MKQRVTRRILCVLMGVALLLSLSGCSGGAVRASSNARKAVASAQNIKITYDELYYLAMTRLDELKKEHEGAEWNEEQVRAELTAFVDEHLLNRTHALLSVAKDYGIDPDRGELGKTIDTHMETVLEEVFGGDREVYIDSLNQGYLTDHYVRTFVAVDDYIATEIVKAMLEKNEIDDSDEAALAIINSDDCIRTVQVFIDKSNGNEDAVNRARATALAQKLAGISDDAERYVAMRDAIGGAYNNDYSDTLGNGYYFMRGEMEQSYEEAAFALPEYGTSDVIETEEGYYVVMRLPKDQTYITRNLDMLKSKSYFVILNEKVEERYEQMQNSFEMTSFGEKLDLMDLPAIDADGGEGIYLVIVAIAIVLAVGGTVFLVRVLVNRKRVAKSKKK